MTKIKELEVKVELWKQSYHASERRLIERGKIINELKEEIGELSENQRTVQDIKNEEIVERLKELRYTKKQLTRDELIDELLKILGDKK